MNVIRVPNHHLPVAPVLDGPQELQNAQAFPQGPPAHAQGLRQVPLRGHFLTDLDLAALDGVDQRPHDFFRDLLVAAPLLCQLHG